MSDETAIPNEPIPPRTPTTTQLFVQLVHTARALAESAAADQARAGNPDIARALELMRSGAAEPVLRIAYTVNLGPMMTASVLLVEDQTNEVVGCLFDYEAKVAKAN